MTGWTIPPICNRYSQRLQLIFIRATFAVYLPCKKYCLKLCRLIWISLNICKIIMLIIFCVQIRKLKLKRLSNSHRAHLEWNSYSNAGLPNPTIHALPLCSTEDSGLSSNRYFSWGGRELKKELLIYEFLWWLQRALANLQKATGLFKFLLFSKLLRPACQGVFTSTHWLGRATKATETKFSW